MKKMLYFKRVTTRRVPINRYGLLGYRPYVEYFKTTDEDFIRRANYGKRVRFEAVPREPMFIHIDPNKIYETEGSK